MSLEIESENNIMNPMEYDFGEISNIPKVSNGDLNNKDNADLQNDIPSNTELLDAIDKKKEPIMINREKPHFFKDKLWNDYQSMFPWLYHSDGRFFCSYCEDAYKQDKRVVPSDWIRGSTSDLKPELHNSFNTYRMRFDRHSKTRNHINANDFLREPLVNSDWKCLKDKYTWLDGDMENTRCLICEQAYKKHKNTMIVTIWTCPELKNQQSPTHFSISHRLDRHEKCNNHLHAVKLEGEVKTITSPSIRQTPTSPSQLVCRASSKSPLEVMRRTRKSAPVKSCKQSNRTLPNAVSTQQYSTLKSRYPWLEILDEISLVCNICPADDCKISFDHDSTLSLISRRILSHCHNDVHERYARECNETNCVTRLQRGVGPKIDYKRLSCGLDDDITSDSEEAPPEKMSSSWSCPQCKSHFPQNHSLIEHINLCDSQSTDVVKELSCPCSPHMNTFSTITKLDMHAAQEHSDQYLFNCYICSDRCTRLLALYEHMLVHHLIDWDPFETYTVLNAPSSPPECIFCCTSFTSNVDLTAHYCISKCQKYLQPTVLIEEIDVSQIPETPNTDDIVDLQEIVNKTRKYRSYPNKLSKESLVLQLPNKLFEEKEIEINYETVQIEKNPKIGTHQGLFEKLIMNVTKGYSSDSLEENTDTKSTVKINRRSVSVDNSHTTRNRNSSGTEKNDAEVEDRQIRFKDLSETRHCRSFTSHKISETSNTIEKTDDTAQPKRRHRKSQLSENSIENSKESIKDEESSNTDKSKSKYENSHMTRHRKSLFSQKSTLASSRPDNLSKRRNCRSLFSRRSIETDIPQDDNPEKDEDYSLDKVKSHNLTTTKPRKSLFSKTLTEIVDETVEKILTASKRKDVKVKVPLKSKPVRNIKKSLFLEEKIEVSVAINDDNVKESQEISIEDKTDKVKNIADESSQIVTPEKKEKQKCLYLDKLKEISAAFNWEVLSDYDKINTSDANSEKEKNKHDLSSQKITQIGASVNTEESAVKDSDGQEEKVDKVSSVQSRKSLFEQQLPDIGAKLSWQMTDSNPSTAHAPQNSGKISYEIISLNPADKPEDKKSETKVTQKDETLLKDHCQGISFGELKVCIEKTDLLIEQQRLKSLIERRKQLPINRLRENLSANVTMLENEKRIRIPSEKLRESSDFSERRRCRRRTASEMRSFIEEQIDVTPVRRQRRNVSELITDKDIDERFTIRDVMKKHLVKKPGYTFDSNRKRKFAHRVKKPKLNKAEEVKEVESSVKSDTKVVNKPEAKEKEKEVEVAKEKEKEVSKPNVDLSKCPKLANLLIEVCEEDSGSHSPDATKLKRPIVIQSQLSPPSKPVISDIQDEHGIPVEISFMDRMKKIRQLKKIRTDQQREQMMAVDRTVAEINEKALIDASVLAKSKIQKLLTCEQYSMSDLKNILQDESKKRKLTDIDESRQAKKPKLESPPKPQRLETPKPPRVEVPKPPRVEVPKSQKSDLQKLQLPCDACDVVFRSLRARDKHIIDEHKGLKIFKCTLCDMSLVTHLALRKHVHKYHPANVQAGISGIGDSHATKAIMFQCHFCSFQCYSKTSLHNHITSFHRTTNDKLKLPTDTDSSAVVVVDDFVRRLKRANPVFKYQECPICNEIMNNEFELAIHTIEHERDNDSDVEANQFACPKCCRLFFGREGKTYLKDHYNIIHLQKPVPSCDECGTEFPSTWCYYEHKRTQKHCSKKNIEQMFLATDPYEPLNDPIRLAFVCSRCQSLVAGDSAQLRFDQHQIDCSQQTADGGDEEEDNEVDDEQESLVMVVDETATIESTVMAASFDLQ